MMREWTEKWAQEQIAKRARTRRRNPGVPPFASTPAGHATPIIRQDPYRNKWERDYAQYLGLQRHCKLIVDFRYEGISFRLADGTHLHPDFLVITQTGMEIHEVKGRAREKWWARFKIAVDMYPWFRWFVCSRTRGGAWELKERKW